MNKKEQALCLILVFKGLEADWRTVMQELSYKPAQIVTTFKIIKVWIILGPKRCQVFQEFMGSRYALQTWQKGKKKKPNVPSNPLERPINHLISTNNTPDWLFQQQYFKKISGVHVSEFTVKGLNIITKGYPDL